MNPLRTKFTALAGTLALTGGLAVVLTNTPPAGATPTFGAPVVVTSLDTSEPGIKAGADGTLYITGPSGLLSNLPGSPSPVFRSTDGGSSWVNTPTSLRANFPGGGDSDVSVDPATGTIYMTDLWLGSSTVAVSKDK